ncbi:MAG: PTS glucose transporter subunit IIA [Actinomycetota bacterium]|jgi:glucose-specific phosphotransferase system IIA component|nr:PTS glucose transporter subunit IIA [Rubrobacter sp.]MDQ3506660.1 PTS glucose transporter subunit IIA [Actinomycetota bacterium]
MEILAPISGDAIPLSKVPDEVFASGMAGDGGAIIPSASGEVLAPIPGNLMKLFEGGHAFGIESDDGIELIVHIGLDTIEMRGEGFEKLARQGDRVEAGQPIVRFDLEKIKEAGYDPATIVVVTNPEEHPVSHVATSGEISAGDAFFRAG